MKDGVGLFWWSDTPIPPRHFAPSDAVGGTFRVRKNGQGSIDLLGYLPRRPNDNSSGDSRLMLEPYGECASISGFVRDTRKFLYVHKPFRNGGAFVSNGLSHEKFRFFSFLTSDKPITNDYYEAVSRLQLDLTGVSKWFFTNSISVIKREHSTSFVHHRKASKIFVNDGVEFKFEFGLTARYFPARISELNVKDGISLSLEFDTPISVGRAAEIKTHIEEFLYLLSGAMLRLPPAHITVGEAVATVHRRDYRTRADVEPNTHEAWFGYNEIENCLSNLLPAWLDLRAKAGPACYLYLSLYKIKRQFAEQRFDTIIKGLEAWHRYFEKPEDTNVKLVQKISRITSQMREGKDRDWLTKRLKHASEPNLEQRIREFVYQSSFAFEKVRVRSFATECASIRNQLAHYGGAQPGSDYDAFVEKAVRFSIALEHIFLGVIATKIGIAKELISALPIAGRRAHHMQLAFRQVGLIA